MIHVVKVKNIPCETCGRKVQWVICFWFDTEKEKEAYLEYLSDPEEDEELLGGPVDLDLNPVVLHQAAARWIGYIKHSKSTYHLCERSQQAPRNAIILSMVDIAIAKEKQNPAGQRLPEGTIISKSRGRGRAKPKDSSPKRTGEKSSHKKKWAASSKKLPPGENFDLHEEVQKDLLKRGLITT